MSTTVSLCLIFLGFLKSGILENRSSRIGSFARNTLICSTVASCLTACSSSTVSYSHLALDAVDALGAVNPCAFCFSRSAFCARAFFFLLLDLFFAHSTHSTHSTASLPFSSQQSCSRKSLTSGFTKSIFGVVLYSRPGRQSPSPVVVPKQIHPAAR